MKNILQKLRCQMAEGLYPGATLGIYHKGQWQEFVLGTQDGKQALESDRIYDLASVSKVLGVATICALLIHRGTLEIDQRLKVYYPEFSEDTVSFRQLLTHTSGIDPFIPNRDSLSAIELRSAINHITVTDQKDFFYTDINFLLLGFMLEKLYGKSLAAIFKQEIFDPWGMSHTSFGPVLGAVPTTKTDCSGRVHDPKARVLGDHAGSAGLFSNLTDLKIFCQHYLADKFAQNLWQNFSLGDKPRSIGWNLDGDWIDHTGYTGPLVMINRRTQQAVIFLTNRTYQGDNRSLWIAKRQELIDVIKTSMETAYSADGVS